MFKNYLKTAFRTLWSQKTSTLINISGLTLGIASSLVLFLMVRHLNSFDTFHVNRDRIYRVVSQSDGNDGKDYYSGVPAPLHEAFRTDFPEAEEVAFFSYSRSGVVTIPMPSGEPKKYDEPKGIVYTLPNYFRLFDRKIIHGDATDNALDEPGEAVLSKSFALKYFGREDALGEVLKYDNREFKVTAIVEDAPTNTDLPFEIILSYSTVKKEREEGGWHSIWSDENCYFMLKPGEKIESVNARMLAFSKKYMGDDTKMIFATQPFSTVHFDERYNNYSYNTVSKTMLSILGVIAVFLIFTACINFINLATAEAIKRSKEVGIRKSLGSTRKQLVMQFLGESGVVTLLAVVAGVLLASGALTFLNPFLDLSLRLNLLSDAGVWLFIAGVSIGVTLLSGLYPSLVVSGFNPVLALKNKIGSRNSSGYNLRRGLVVLQFFISQFFIIGTIVLISQMNYFKNKDLGFKKDAIINIPLPSGRLPSDADAGFAMRTLREEIARVPGVENLSLNNSPPASGNVNGSNFTVEGNPKDFETQMKMVDGNYVPVFGLKLIAGQNLPDADTVRGYLVNERLTRLAGYSNPQDMVGVRMKVWGKFMPVLGVVADFHTMSLRENIEPTVLFNKTSNVRNISAKIAPERLQETIAGIQKLWERAYPEYIFTYQFMDENVKEFYEREQKMSVLLSVFTGMAIFIGCLGLFGLASFMANQKTKEIGVRKVLGASVESIVLMFSREYLILIGVAFLLAAPVAGYVMNEWLNGFAYKITIGPMIFVIGLATTLLIALITVGYRSYSAAAINPAQSLKSE